MSGTTGGASGRAGGQASASARRKTALGSTTSVRVLSVGRGTPRANPATPMRTEPTLDVEGLATLATAVATSVVANLALSPKSTEGAMLLAGAVVAMPTHARRPRL